MSQEGVIKFDLKQNDTLLQEPAEFAVLEKNRQKLFEHKLVGQNDELYDGYAYGNVSMRISATEFLISGSQTSGRATLGINDYALVHQCDIVRNRVIASGKTKASSESLSHAMLYQLNPDIQFVFHVHNKTIWQQTDLPAIAENIEYGSVEMATAIQQLIQQQNWQSSGLFIMSGHEDGAIAFGTDADNVANILVSASV